MSQKYDEYLHEHISNVNKAGEWLIDHGLVEEDSVDILRQFLKKHDASKFNPQEYDPYDDYFYGKGKNDPDTKEAFDYAWLEHIHHNPHHWQYWVLINDDDGTTPLEMPQEYVYEMIADWWSFSWKNGDLFEIFDWYAEHGTSAMLLHLDTRKLVEDILDQIEKILSREKHT